MKVAVSQKSKKQEKTGLLVVSLIWVLFLVFFVLYFFQYCKFHVYASDIEYIAYCIYGLLMFYLSFLVSLIIHETGHLVFGALAGYQFVSFSLLSWMLVKKPDGKIGIKRLSTSSIAGQCLMAPPSKQNKKQEEKGALLYHYGGCLMNLIAAAILLVLYLFSTRYGLWGCFCYMMMIGNVQCALSNGIPIRTKGVVNDGFNASLVKKNPALNKVVYLQLETASAYAKGLPASALPEEWFTQETIQDISNPLSGFIPLLQISRLSENGQYQQLIDYTNSLDWENNGLNGVHVHGAGLEYLFALLMSGQNEEAQEILNQKTWKNALMKIQRDPAGNRILYAAAILLEKDPQKAEKARKRFEQNAKNYPFKGELEAERKMLEAVDAYAESLKTSSEEQTANESLPSSPAEVSGDQEANESLPTSPTAVSENPEANDSLTRCPSETGADVAASAAQVAEGDQASDSCQRSADSVEGNEPLTDPSNSTHTMEAALAEDPFDRPSDIAPESKPGNQPSKGQSIKDLGSSDHL